MEKSDTQDNVVLALVRHGETQESAGRRFAGWNDVELTERGYEEAYMAGIGLRAQGIEFDVCLTSMLTRAIDSAHWMLKGLGTAWLPMHKHWRLNERHMGDLTGCPLSEIRSRLNDEQWRIWEQKLDFKPQAPSNEFAAEVQKRLLADRRYAGVEIPESESNAEVSSRVLPYWMYEVVPRLLQGENVLIVSHSNVLGNLLRIIERKTFTGPPKSLKHCEPVVLRLKLSDLAITGEIAGKKNNESVPVA